MMKKARWMPMPLAALFLVPCAWADVQVVDVDGTEYTVRVVDVCSSTPNATALSYKVFRPGDPPVSDWINLTQDPMSDRDPSLALVSGSGGPFLIWSRNDGSHQQIAYSRFAGGSWTEPRYLTSGSRDHLLQPGMGVDSHGRGYVVWVEPTGIGSVKFATFDPATGILMTSARDLLDELVRNSPAEWLGPDRPFPPGLGPRTVLTRPSPDGGSDVPAIPPANSKHSNPPSGDVSVTPTCSKAVAAVVKERALFIGVLEGGVVLKYYRSVIPQGAPDDYVDDLLETLLNRHCQ